MPWLKRQLTKLPRPVPDGLVIPANENGEIVRSLHDTSGQHLRMVTW